ncbi:DUF6491 family protein [Dokdonella sp.]|uniref:DUF6491 family protein n=1 Tax=Dokdonella sp. TaxID=2291710 RepID=UPI003C564DA7
MVAEGLRDGVEALADRLGANRQRGRIRGIGDVWSSLCVILGYQIHFRTLRQPVRILFAVLTLLAMSVAFAQEPEEQGEQPIEYLLYAGEPVDNFRMPKLVRWEVVGRYSVVVWPRVSEAYLLTVEPPCFDLESTDELSLNSKAGIVSRKFDSVLIRRGKCRINGIRPIDYKKFLADRKEAREEPGS